MSGSREREGAELLASPVLADTEWQMHYGERFALEGILGAIRPELSIEIGRAEGGSLRRIAAYSREVHSFDLVPEPDGLRAAVDNVTFHTGDSHAQVPEVLAELAAAGRTVDFALVDGDHTADGVRRDAEALLASPACRNTTIVFHDAANDDVRAGLDAVRFAARPEVALAMLDFVPGFVVERGGFAGQIWNGLGVVVTGRRSGPEPITEHYRYDMAALNRQIRDIVVAGADGIAPRAGADPAPAPRPAPPADAAPERRSGPGVRGTIAVAAVSAAAGAAAAWAGLQRRR